ncbi:hypothetical protein ACJ41O_011771 [Fusarium nematophilum]
MSGQSGDDFDPIWYQINYDPVQDQLGSEGEFDSDETDSQPDGNADAPEPGPQPISDGATAPSDTKPSPPSDGGAPLETGWPTSSESAPSEVNPPRPSDPKEICFVCGTHLPITLGDPRPCLLPACGHISCLECMEEENREACGVGGLLPRKCAMCGTAQDCATCGRPIDKEDVWYAA